MLVWVTLGVFVNDDVGVLLRDDVAVRVELNVGVLVRVSVGGLLLLALTVPVLLVDGVAVSLCVREPDGEELNDILDDAVSLADLDADAEPDGDSDDELLGEADEDELWLEEELGEDVAEAVWLGVCVRELVDVWV